MTPTRLILLFLIIISGGFAVWRESGPYHLPVFAPFLYIPFLLLIVFTIWSFYVDKNYKTENKFLRYKTTIVGLLLCSFVLFKIRDRAIIDNKETLLVVSNLAGANNVMSFEFKKGDFKLTETDLLSSTIYYGTYRKSGDTIWILESNYSNGYYARSLPLKGIIKGGKMLWDKFDTMLINEMQ